MGLTIALGSVATELDNSLNSGGDPKGSAPPKGLGVDSMVWTILDSESSSRFASCGDMLYGDGGRFSLVWRMREALCVPRKLWRCTLDVERADWSGKSPNHNHIHIIAWIGILLYFSQVYFVVTD